MLQEKKITCSYVSFAFSGLAIYVYMLPHL
jgi:hypothetical protein